MLFKKTPNPPLWKGVAEFIFQNSPDAYWALEGGIICDCNPASEKIFGVPRDKLIGMTPERFSPERQPDGRLTSDLAPAYINTALTNGRHRFEWMHQRLDGSPMPTEVTLMRAEVHGRQLLIAMLNDRRETDQLRKAEQAAQAKSAEAGLQRVALDTLAGALSGLAQGDLTARLEAGLSGDFVKVRDDFNAAAQKLAQAMREVSQSTHNIQSGAQEVSQNSDELSQRTERQAANLEETVAALGEITQTLKNSAEGARHAAEVVATADRNAKEGAIVVKQAVAAMDAISRSAAEIGQIIGVIDEIAFQTNLLALNAGVEAARAGESGKGFAVVASEVRGLAQRSAEAAKEIKALISTSGTQVGAGVQLVADTGKALERIIAQVSEINSVVAQIASGAREQSSALQEVNTAINEMDKATQQNATMVEKSTASCHSLSKEAERLAQLVAQFRLETGRGAQIRGELQKAAPHAFAKPARPSVKSEPRPTRPKVVASGGGRGSGDWNEF
jgi:methyl-accepting chemotaxis protein